MGLHWDHISDGWMTLGGAEGLGYTWQYLALLLAELRNHSCSRNCVLKFKLELATCKESALTLVRTSLPSPEYVCCMYEAQECMLLDWVDCIVDR